MGPRRLIGLRLLDQDGNNIGKIGQVFLDDQTDAAKWVTVRTGLLGTSENLVPLQGAYAVDGDLQVPYRKETVRGAPSFESDQHISAEEEDRVYRHYGLDVPGPREEQRPRGKHARPTGQSDQPDLARPREEPLTYRHGSASADYDGLPPAS
ncbi:MAG: PRC-barrel domain-containing protein [Nocardiopsaceae bacterium]|nr:PRC-barrel domain-containing protein [Nocardiopsaceae bacterium]